MQLPFQVLAVVAAVAAKYVANRTELHEHRTETETEIYRNEYETQIKLIDSGLRDTIDILRYTILDDI